MIRSFLVRRAGSLARGPLERPRGGRLIDPKRDGAALQGQDLGAGRSVDGGWFGQPDQTARGGCGFEAGQSDVAQEALVELGQLARPGASADTAPQRSDLGADAP